ncbi:MAG: hypothetical protein QOI34_1322 [Verrucomicrobiota bacterium]
MPRSAKRWNLIVAAVAVGAVAGYAAYVRTEWNYLQSKRGIKPLVTGRSSERVAHSDNRNFKSRVPDWVPLYPGTVPESLSSSQAGIEHYFDVQMRTHDHCARVVDWYEKKLIAAGYKTYGRFDYEDPTCTSIVQSDGPNFHRSINVRASGSSSDVTISVRAIERQVTGGATPDIPKWVPMYPGAPPPKHLDAAPADDGAYRLAFSFESPDDPSQVYVWYQTRLKKLGFDARFEVNPRSAGQFFSRTADNKRSFNIHNYPGTPDNSFVVEVIER